MKVEPRFLVGQGREVFVGNELLLKGALEVEGGVHLLGGYPGSPVAGFFDAMGQIKDLLNEKGIRAVINNNEALSAAMLNGSQVAGCRGLICMKSVGVHVAADGLAIGNLAGPHPDGGAVVVYGDDPWSDSTQVPSDSRYISKHLFIPVVEPSNPQEIKDYVGLAFKLSRRSQLYAGYVLTNNLADGGGTVECRPNQYPTLNMHQRKAMESAAIDVDRFVLLPPKTWWQEEKLAPRFAKAAVVARELGLNRIDYPATRRKSLGFATSGLAHGYLLQALWELGLLGEYPILKFGMSYPVDPEMVRQFSQQCERIIVIEERRGFLEEQINEVVLKDRQFGRPSGNVEVWGKQFPGDLKAIPSTRGLHPSIIIGRLVPLLKAVNGAGSQIAVPAAYEGLDRELQTIDSTGQAEVPSLPGRLPSFCPGCPHRDSADVCLEIRKHFMDPQYMQQTYGRAPVDLVFHGDTGCYTMLMYPPNTQLMHNYSGMGLGGGTGSGMDPFITNKQAVFMGDSTFFHSGQIAISQAIKLGQDITFIILDNRTTAMTGHQPTPGVEYDVVGNPTPIQEIEDILQGMASNTEMVIVRANPQKRKPYRRLLEKTFLTDGVKVIIADKECGITRTRRRRRQERNIIRQRGYLPSWEHMNINQEVCRFCLACAEMTGCPGLRHEHTDYGRKMNTDVSWCVADGACARIGACWSFEHVTIHRKRPPRGRVPELGLDSIPEPRKRPPLKLWQCYLAGVGGMGIGLATSILVRAGHNEGFRVAFVDKKGLAIRNGGVNSQVVFTHGDEPVTGIVPFGKADLIVGVDILEAARAIDPTGRMRVASADRTAAVVNTDKVATILGVMGEPDFEPANLEQTIRANTRSDDYLARDISRICEKYLGSKLYANIMMLGFAFQKGLIPVSMHSMAWAIKDTIRADFKKNLYAFNMGRKLVEDQNLFQGAPERTGWKETLEERCRYTIRRYLRGQKLSDALRELAQGAVASAGELPESTKRDIVVRLYDCMRWGGIDHARRYAEGVMEVYAKDNAAHGWAATQAVVHNLAQAMLVKDAIFIAELATSPEKYAHDRDKYNVNPANGDRIAYSHLLPMHTHLFGRPASFDMTVPPWPLKILKRLRFLRALLPAWHKDKRQFLKDYRARIDAFTGATPEQYRLGLMALSSARCMNCLNPRCQEVGCPLGGLVPQWVDLANRQQWRQASQKLHERNNFPEFTSLICPAKCQEVCKQGLNDYPVEIRDIERQIIQRAFESGWVAPEPAIHKTGKRVAVIGSGPAGLAAAQQLARAGHDVTVFEKDDHIGGLLRYGIPDFRLPKKLIDRRVEQLQAEGVKFQTRAQVGKDVAAGALKGQFNAICLATGAARPRDLRVPGREKHGVHFALDFLQQQNRRAAGQTIAEKEAIHAQGKVVAVIGGGLTGEDCVDTALAQGAKQVHQFEILPQPDPAGHAHAGDVGHAHAGAVQRQWCVATKRFNDDGRRITELSGIAVKWVQSPTGRRIAEVPGSEFTLKVDLALLALGFEPIDIPLADQFGLATDDAGRIVANEELATSVPSIFAAGDLLNGASYVAAAIASGRQVAEKIDHYLMRQ